jgi:hypothetical protein
MQATPDGVVRALARTRICICCLDFGPRATPSRSLSISLSKVPISGAVSMMRIRHGLLITIRTAAAILFFLLCQPSSVATNTQSSSAFPTRAFYIDCSLQDSGDGSLSRPWNSLASAQSHPYSPGDRIALARGTTCHGTFSPQGSGTSEHPIRLTAYGNGPRPRIVASGKDREALLLFNQEHWQIDSLDVSGSNKYGDLRQRRPRHHA